MSPRTDALKKAQKAYISKFSRIEIRVTKEEQDEIQAHARTRDESVTGFIKRSIQETMRRDKDWTGI